MTHPTSQEAREYPPLPEPLGYMSPGDVALLADNAKQYRGRNYNYKATVFLDHGHSAGSATEPVFTAKTLRSYVDSDRAARREEALDTLRGLDSDTRVRFYEHDFYVLSNFSAFRLQWKGLRFDTSEAAYHWEKFGEHYTALRHEIQAAPSAHEAFKMAERNKHCRRRDWDDVKVGVMLDILRAKAEQHEYVRRKLLATGDRELVEDSWRDDFWGWGPNRDGKNMLGRLWMQVRDELRAAIAKGAGT